MINFLKFFAQRMGNAAYGLGMVGIVLTVGITAYEIYAYSTAETVQARVSDVEVQCTLSTRSRTLTGRTRTRTSDKMNCAIAEALKAANPLEGYRLQEHRRTLLSYSTPAGTPFEKWTGIGKGDDLQPLVVGDTVTVMIGQDDPTDVRGLRKASDLRFAAIALGVSLSALLIGWALKSMGHGARMPEPWWRRLRKRSQGAEEVVLRPR